MLLAVLLLTCSGVLSNDGEVARLSRHAVTQARTERSHLTRTRENTGLSTNRYLGRD